MYTEDMTRSYYDAEDATYRNFWDPEGSLHWGVFDPGDNDFLGGCTRWTDEMAHAAHIRPESHVLDLGCGNGQVAARLAETTGAAVTGIDLSPVRIQRARARSAADPLLRLNFLVSSAATLPFPNEHFTHVFSQAVLYHVHDRAAAITEIERVLQPDGVLAIDDLVTPQRPVGALARRTIYDRLLFEPTFSALEYRHALTSQGFVVYESRDLSQHLARSYALLAERAREHHPELAATYDQVPQVVSDGQVGWSFFLCQKASDRLGWIYSTDPRFDLAQKYDAWAADYDADLHDGYARNCQRAAALLSRCLPEREVAILDAGAGTGLVGDALSAAGYADLTALDRSEGMLARARTKGVYRNIVHGAISEAPLLLAERRFSAITAVGVFTYGHADSNDLIALDSLLEPGGWLLIAARVDFIEDHPEILNTLTVLRYITVARDHYEILDGEPVVALALRKPHNDIHENDRLPTS